MLDMDWLAKQGLAAPPGTFVEGVRCTWGTATAVKVGILLGQLHSLEPPVGVPNSWYHPLPHVLKEAQKWLKQYPDLKNGLVQLDIVERCPISLIHADVWNGNIIESPNGELTLIDWEGSGIGHSILDLCDAAADCASAPLLLAMISGYEKVRRLSPVERASLMPAMQIAIAIRVAKKVKAGRLDSIPREIDRFERSHLFRL